MKLLIIQGDPDEGSFCHANAMNYYQQAQKLGFDVKMVDLAKDQFEPVLRFGYRKHMADESYPHKMQQLIKAADHLAFFFPVWWSAEPSILKGWIERVLTPRFAYHYQGHSVKKYLTGRTAELFLTCHAPTFFYSLYGGVITRWKHMILGFCGIKLIHHLIMGNMNSKQDTEARRKKFMQKCANSLVKLQTK